MRLDASASNATRLWLLGVTIRDVVRGVAGLVIHR